MSNTTITRHRMSWVPSIEDPARIGGLKLYCACGTRGQLKLGLGTLDDLAVNAQSWMRAHEATSRP